MGRRFLPYLVAAVDAAVAVVYLSLLASQPGSHSARTIAFFAMLCVLAVLCLLTGLGTTRFPRASDDLRLSAAAGNAGLGIVALASIGLPLLAAGLVLLTRAPAHVRSAPRRLLAPAVTVLLIVLVMLTTRGR